jgi:uncharacterized membrane protein YqjE
VVSVLRRLLGSAAGIAATHLEWVALEIEAERQRLARLWMHAALTLLLLFTGIWLGVAGLLLWAEPPQRAAIAAGLALVFLAATAVASWSWRRLRMSPSRLRYSAISANRALTR